MEIFRGRNGTAILILAILLLHHHHYQVSSSSTAPIKTVVVVVMENRSFDHMLGWMKKLNADINGVTGSESNPVSTTDPNSPRIYFQNQSHFVDPDPGHSFQAIREQIFGSNDTSLYPPPMNGFAQQANSMEPDMPQAVMNGFEPDKVAVYEALVSEFAVFDRWFASVPASTQPNRLYVHSGTSHGATSNDAAQLAKGFPQRTVFENIEDAGMSFGIYFENIPATLFYRNLRKIKYLGNFHPYGLSFKSDAAKGKLPNYVVVEQRYLDTKVAPANDDHPSHDVYQGQMFVKEVYETLRASPQWNETLMIITYDEHGGFYDHVATPTRGVPSPDDIVGPEPFLFKFDRLGVRVPTIVVSPWIEKGTGEIYSSNREIYSREIGRTQWLLKFSTIIIPSLFFIVLFLIMCLGSIASIRRVTRNRNQIGFDSLDILEKNKVVSLNFFCRYTTTYEPGHILPPIRSVLIINSQRCLEQLVLFGCP